MTTAGAASGRSADVDARIEAAALELLRGRGPLAVTIEAVAAESGIAKTTIYRRFDNRDALLAHVVSAATRVVEVPLGRTARDVLHWYLGEARDTIEYIVGRGAVAAILVDEDHRFTALLLDMVRTRSRPLRVDLAARCNAGELRRDLDVELVISILLGTFVAESIRGRTTDAAWADEVLDALWPSLAPPSPPSGSSPPSGRLPPPPGAAQG
ncbi:helix-turn-helix domain-containing protein [Galbitalea sp. SE-J8]|uniref:TetR/AcrR family transcriptional regulator n=1 Tax=Galbitalea sp. SE-J8 TaxID=3054952 RepID=UPI00259C72CF|nr:TetR/AcrR family transcriptional regulator [Galbitalea sp. SE-J8]MDM4761773.1 helix-turn-helix domain-containing protein [Galbitalea sp. SE-J8]